MLLRRIGVLIAVIVLLFALGRIKTVKSCHIWTASIETILRWAGLANDWYVEEVECGSVTGTFDCVFAIRSVET